MTCLTRALLGRGWREGLILVEAGLDLTMTCRHQGHQNAWNLAAITTTMWLESWQILDWLSIYNLFTNSTHIAQHIVHNGTNTKHNVINNTNKKSQHRCHTQHKHLNETTNNTHTQTPHTTHPKQHNTTQQTPRHNTANHTAQRNNHQNKHHIHQVNPHLSFTVEPVKRPRQPPELSCSHGSRGLSLSLCYCLARRQLKLIVGRPPPRRESPCVGRCTLYELLGIVAECIFFFLSWG